MPHDLRAPRVVVASGMAGVGVTFIAQQLQRLAPRLNVVESGRERTDILEACTPGLARLLAVTTNDIIAVTATYALVKLVRDRFPDTPIEIIVNRCEARDALKPYERIQGAAMHFLGETVGFGGSIPDVNGGIAVDAGDPDSDTGPALTIEEELMDDTPVVAAIGNIATRLDEELTTQKSRPAYYSAERRNT